MSYQFEVILVLASVGAVLGHQRSGLPAGPVVVLSVTALVIVSILFAPRRGLVWGLFRKRVTA